MSRIAKPSVALPIALALAISAHGQGKIEGQGAATRFISEKYGFSIAVPPGWHASLERDLPIYVNFTETRGPQQLTLPAHGATIVVVAQETLPGRRRLAKSPSDWAEIDARGVSSGDPAISAMEMPKESGVSKATTSSYDEATFSADDQAQHSLAAFWEFDHKLFAAHLNYIVNDPDGPTLEKLLLETIRSIRPLKPNH